MSPCQCSIVTCESTERTRAEPKRCRFSSAIAARYLRQDRKRVIAAFECVCWSSVAWRGRWGLGSLPDQDGWRQPDDAVASAAAGVVLRRRRRRGRRVERHVRIHRDPRLDRREAWVDGIGGGDGRGSGYSGRRVCSHGWGLAGARARISRGGARRATHDGYGDEARAQSRRD